MELDPITQQDAMKQAKGKIVSNLTKLLLAIGVFLAVTLSAYTYASAQDTPPVPNTAPKFGAEENGARKIIQGLGILLKSIPQYELPIVLENGDILIRCIQKTKHPEVQNKS